MYDEKSLSNVEVSGARGSPEELEGHSRPALFFTTPSLTRACSALKMSHKKAQKTLTGELVYSGYLRSRVLGRRTLWLRWTPCRLLPMRRPSRRAVLMNDLPSPMIIPYPSKTRDIQWSSMEMVFISFPRITP